MRTMLRLAGTAMAVALVLATPSVAVAGEPAAGVDPAASAVGSDLPTGCDDAAPAVTAGAPADEQVTDDQAGQGMIGEPCPGPTDQPTTEPVDPPTTEPVDQPTTEPVDQPSGDPSDQPTTEPVDQPSGDPSDQPTTEPVDQPSGDPSDQPTTEPVDQPSGDPSDQPTTEPVDQPSGDPSDQPTTEPVDQPSTGPTDLPSGEPPEQSSGDPAGASPEVHVPDPAGQPESTGTPPRAAPAASPSIGGPVVSAPTAGAMGAAVSTMTPLAVLTTMPAGPSPLTVPYATVDVFPAYDPQVFCDPTPKPGTEYLARLAISYFGAGHLSGISRDCSVGPTSEHKEGRAFDWALSVGVPEEKAAGDAFAQWLTAVGPDGKVAYNARRLGVMYLIWNEQIWLNSDANASWHAYHGPSPHTDHVHVSLTWAGAYERTSWWTGDPIPDRAELARLAGQAWARVFGHEPDAALLDAWISRLADRGALPLTGVGLSRLAVAFAVVLDAGRWGLDRPAPEPGGAEWATTVGRSVI